MFLMMLRTCIEMRLRFETAVKKINVILCYSFLHMFVEIYYILEEHLITQLFTSCDQDYFD